MPPTITVDLPVLLLGIALLWFPRHWIRRVVAMLQRRRRSSPSGRVTDPWKEREPGDPRVAFGVEFRKVRNYFDLLRAGAGSLAIWGGLGVAPALTVAAEAPGRVGLQVLAAKALIMLGGLVIQAVRYENRRVSFYPPIFYLAGISVGLCGYKAAGFAFVLIWTVNTGLGNAQAFLAVYSVILYIFGALFASFSSPAVMLASGLAMLPVLLSLLADRPLVVYTRKGSRSR
jgi:hypothetical protein